MRAQDESPKIVKEDREGKPTPKDLQENKPKNELDNKEIKINLLARLDPMKQSDFSSVPQPFVISSQGEKPVIKVSAVEELESQQSAELPDQISLTAQREESIPPIFSEAKAEIPKQKENKSSIKEAKAYIENLYQPVADGIREIQIDSRQHIFSKQALDPIFWPVLPKGYKWFIENPEKMPVVRKNSENPEQPFEIIIYGPNDQKNPKTRVNYVTWFGDLNIQAYANTRLTAVPAKSRKYPQGLKKPEFYKTLDGRQYDRSHCIDHGDTITQDGLRSSTHDIRNFMPELEKWNRHIRNHWVKRIRKSHGAYMQRVYYHNASHYDYDPRFGRTQNGAAIPAGVYFAEIDWERKGIIQTVDINSAYDLNSIIQNPTYLDHALAVFSMNSSYMPTALTYRAAATCEDIDQTMLIYEQKINALQPVVLQNAAAQRLMLEQLYQAAETEYLRFDLKFSYSLWCAYLGLHQQALTYLKRAENHAGQLNALDVDCRLSQSDFSIFTQNHQAGIPGFTEERLDFWQGFVKS